MTTPDEPASMTPATRFAHIGPPLGAVRHVHWQLDGYRFRDFEGTARRGGQARVHIYGSTKGRRLDAAGGSPCIPATWTHDWVATESIAEEAVAERLAGWRARYPDMPVDRDVVCDKPARVPVIVARESADHKH